MSHVSPVSTQTVVDLLAADPQAATLIADLPALLITQLPSHSSPHPSSLVESRGPLTEGEGSLRRNIKNPPHVLLIQRHRVTLRYLNKDVEEEFLLFLVQHWNARLLYYGILTVCAAVLSGVFLPRVLIAQIMVGVAIVLLALAGLETFFLKRSYDISLASKDEALTVLGDPRLTTGKLRGIGTWTELVTIFSFAANAILMAALPYQKIGCYGLTNEEEKDEACYRRFAVDGLALTIQMLPLVFATVRWAAFFGASVLWIVTFAVGNLTAREAYRADRFSASMIVVVVQAVVCMQWQYAREIHLRDAFDLRVQHEFQLREVIYLQEQSTLMASQQMSPHALDVTMRVSAAGGFLEVRGYLFTFAMGNFAAWASCRAPCDVADMVLRTFPLFDGLPEEVGEEGFNGLRLQSFGDMYLCFIEHIAAQRGAVVSMGMLIEAAKRVIGLVDKEVGRSDSHHHHLVTKQRCLEGRYHAHRLYPVAYVTGGVLQLVLIRGTALCGVGGMIQEALRGVSDLQRGVPQLGHDALEPTSAVPLEKRIGAKDIADMTNSFHSDGSLWSLRPSATSGSGPPQDHSGSVRSPLPVKVHQSPAKKCDECRRGANEVKPPQEADNALDVLSQESFHFGAFSKFKDPVMEAKFWASMSSWRSTKGSLTRSGVYMILYALAMFGICGVYNVWGEWGVGSPTPFIAACGAIGVAVVLAAVLLPSISSEEVPRLGFDIAFTSYAVLLVCASVFSMPTSLIGLSTVPWMSLARTLSLSRPPWRSPLFMWYQDVFVFTIVLCDTLLHPSKYPPQLRLGHVFVHVFVLVYALLIHRAIHIIERELFVAAVEVVILMTSIQKSYERVQQVLEECAPLGIAAQMIERQRRRNAWPSVKYESGPSFSLHPCRSTLLATAVDDVCFALIRLPDISCASDPKQWVVSYQRLHAVINRLTRSTSERSCALQLVKSCGDTLMLCTGLNKEAECLGVGLHGLAMLRLISALHASLAEVEGPTGLSVVALVGAAPVVGCVVDGQFECYGGAVASLHRYLDLALELGLMKPGKTAVTRRLANAVLVASPPESRCGVLSEDARTLCRWRCSGLPDLWVRLS